MAIYTTFFLCEPADLAAGFPGWPPPLAQPVRRAFKNPFTGELTIIETREPEWSDEEETEDTDEYCAVVVLAGHYEDYLEDRLPPFIRNRPHWAAKGLSNVELDPLAQAAGVESALEGVLYGRRARCEIVQQVCPDLLAMLLALDRESIEAIANRWAATMSTPESTHSVTGIPLSEGWTAREALEILDQMPALARKASAQQGMYLIIDF